MQEFNLLALGSQTWEIYLKVLASNLVLHDAVKQIALYNFRIFHLNIFVSSHLKQKLSSLSQIHNQTKWAVFDFLC